MARKPTRAVETAAAKPRKPAPAPASARPKNGNGVGAAASKAAQEARTDLLARAAENEKGGSMLRSDPLADALAARQVVEFAAAHGQELSRRGLHAHQGEAALVLAHEIEDHLQALPATATAARARSPEAAELIADAAALVQPAREAVLRVTRGADGRRAAHAFGIGELYGARQPHLVLRALRRIVSGADEFPSVAADAGLIADDLRAMAELADELEGLGGGQNGQHDELTALHEAHGALRAYFDLVAAKGALAFAADTDERVRLCALIPRGPDRRHARQAADQAPAA